MRTSEILIFLLFLYLYTPSKAAESCEMIKPKSFDDCKGATSSYGDIAVMDMYHLPMENIICAFLLPRLNIKIKKLLLSN